MHEAWDSLNPAIKPYQRSWGFKRGIPCDFPNCESNVTRPCSDCGAYLCPSHMSGWSYRPLCGTMASPEPTPRYRWASKANYLHWLPESQLNEQLEFDLDE